jgi:hypothetical protein
VFKTFEKCLPKKENKENSSGCKKAKCFRIEIVLKARLMEWKIHKRRAKNEKK